MYFCYAVLYINTPLTKLLITCSFIVIATLAIVSLTYIYFCDNPKVKNSFSCLHIHIQIKKFNSRMTMLLLFSFVPMIYCHSVVEFSLPRAKCVCTVLYFHQESLRRKAPSEPVKRISLLITFYHLSRTLGVLKDVCR